MTLNFSKVVELINQKKFYDSLKLLDQMEQDNKEDFQILNFKGFVLLNIYEFEKSIKYFTKALTKKDDSFLTLCYRSEAYTEMGNFNNALIDLQKAQNINSRSHEVCFSIGDCYSNLGDNNKAIEFFRKTLELKPDFKIAIENLITKLAEINSVRDSENIYIKVNSNINDINYFYSNNEFIKDDLIKDIFNKSNALIVKNFKNLSSSQTQIYRRNNENLNCDRHFRVFNNFMAIPKYCFSCFKVTIEINNVLNLIKLYLIFDNINLKNNNIRKCMIESRPDVKGFYKGFIYCKSLEEAENIKSKLEIIIKENIGPNIFIEIKRGCTEFGVKYPSYKYLKGEVMKYNENWSKFETTVDKKFPKFTVNTKIRQSKKGLNLRDILIIKNWLYFAKLINDQSYKKISEDNIINDFIKEKFSEKVKKINN